MLKWLIRNRIRAFERELGYDASYARFVLDTDARAFFKLARIQKSLGYRRALPTAVYYAIAVTGTLAEDCGPCTQLTVTMALKDGVDPRLIASVIEGNEALMTEEVRLGTRFARAVLAHAPEADDHRDEIARRWGPRAVIAAAFAITGARFYPTIKYALGYGKACQRVVVGDEAVIPVRPLTTATTLHA